MIGGYRQRTAQIREGHIPGWVYDLRPTWRYAMVVEAAIGESAGAQQQGAGVGAIAVTDGTARTEEKP